MMNWIRHVGTYIYIKVKVKWSRYTPGVAQRVGRGIALLFHDRGTRRGWVVSSTPWSHFTPRKDPVPILQEAGWAPGPVWTGGKSRPHRGSLPDRPARSQLLYRLSYPAHTHTHTHTHTRRHISKYRSRQQQNSTSVPLSEPQNQINDSSEDCFERCQWREPVQYSVSDLTLTLPTGRHLTPQT